MKSILKDHGVEAGEGAWVYNETAYTDQTALLDALLADGQITSGGYLWGGVVYESEEEVADAILFAEYGIDGLNMEDIRKLLDLI